MKTRRRQFHRRTERIRDPERGMALLVSSLMMLMVAGIAFAAINQAGVESTAGGRVRATTRNLYAAEAGIQLAMRRLANSPPNTASFSIPLDGGRTVESRRRADPAPVPLTRTGYGPPPEGYELNEGGTSFYTEIYTVNVTATAPNGTITELEAKISVLKAGTVVE